MDFARYQDSLRSGHEQAAEGKFKDALRHYQAAVELARERALPLVCMGGMYLRLAQPRDALDAYEHALALEPLDVDALSGTAAALLALGRRTEATEVQARMADLRARPAPGIASDAPTGDATPISRADALMLAGDQARAIGNVGAAVDAWLAESVEHAAQAHLDAAIDAALRALGLDPSSVAVHLALARLYYQHGWHERADERVALLRRLLELAPDENALRDLEAFLAGERGGTGAQPADG